MIIKKDLLYKAKKQITPKTNFIWLFFLIILLELEKFNGQL